MPAVTQDHNTLWVKAFATQSIADLETRDLLSSVSAKKCHRLHFLQMSAEKLCKAYLAQENGIEQLAYRHCIVAKTLPLVLRRTLEIQGHSRARVEAQLRAIRRLSHLIELLSLSCDDGGSNPQNVEYPWQEAGDSVGTPSHYSFPNFADESRELLAITKLMRAAAEVYLA